MLRREFQLRGHHQGRWRPWPHVVLAAWRAILCNRVRNVTWRLQKEQEASQIMRALAHYHQTFKTLCITKRSAKIYPGQTLLVTVDFYLPKARFNSILTRFCVVSCLPRFHLCCVDFPFIISVVTRLCGEAAAWCWYLFASEFHSLRKSICFWPLSCQM